MVDRRVVNSQDASTVVRVVNKIDRRRVLLTTRSTCRGEIFQVQSWRQREVPSFWRYPYFLINTVNDRWNKASISEVTTLWRYTNLFIIIIIIVSKTISIRLTIFAELRLVTFRHSVTDTEPWHIPR